MSGPRLKLALILAAIALGGLILLCWTQQWFSIQLSSGQRLSVAGQVAASGLSALGLACLALAGVLAIAGRVLRVILGVVLLGIGALVAVTAATALRDPVAASAQAVTDATAIGGAQSIAALVVGVSSTAWPWLALVSGALCGLVGIAVALSSRRWPGASRKYDTAAAAPTDGSAVDAWDALSRGSDPTGRS